MKTIHRKGKEHYQKDGRQGHCHVNVFLGLCFFVFLVMLVWVSHRVSEWQAGFINLCRPWTHEFLKATCLCGPSRLYMQQGPPASASSLSSPEGTAAQRQLFIMRSFFLLLFPLLLVSHGSSAVITGVSGSKQVDTVPHGVRWETLGVMGIWKSLLFKKENAAWCALLNI